MATIPHFEVDENGAPTQVGTIAVPDASVNRDRIQTQAATALANNRTYLAIATPTTAQMRNQIDALTRQNQGIIRLLLNQLDAVN